MKKTFTIFILFIAFTSMLHGMHRNRNTVFNWYTDKNNSEKLNDQLKAIGKRRPSVERNRIKNRLTFLEAERIYNKTNKKCTLNWLDANLSELKYEQLKIDLSGLVNKDIIIQTSAINYVEKKHISTHLLPRLLAIEKMRDLFKNPDKVSALLPVKYDELEKLNLIVPGLVNNDGNNIFSLAIENRASLLQLKLLRKHCYHSKKLGTKILHSAIESGRTDIIKLIHFLLENYITKREKRFTEKSVPLNVNGQNNFEQTPLHLACSKTLEPKIIKVLLDHGAQVDIEDINGDTAFDILFNNFDLTDTKRFVKIVKIVRMIIEKHPDDKIENSKNSFTQFMLEHIQSAPINLPHKNLLDDINNLLEQKRKEQQSKEKQSKEKEKEKSRQRLLDTRSSRIKKASETQQQQNNQSNFNDKEKKLLLKKFFKALRTCKQTKKFFKNNTIETIEKYINKKNNFFETPLIIAIKNGNIEGFKMLLDNGADYNQKFKIELTKKSVLNNELIKEEKNLNILEYILIVSQLNLNKNQKINFIKVLLKKDLFIIKNNKSNTLLIDVLLINGDQSEIIKLLLCNHININQKSKNGITPLHYAIFIKKNLEIINLLLENGANPNIKLPNDKTILEAMIENKKLYDNDANFIFIIIELLINGARCKKGLICFNEKPVDFNCTSEIEDIKNKIEKCSKICTYYNKKTFYIYTDPKLIFWKLISTENSKEIGRFLEHNKENIDIFNEFNNNIDSFAFDYIIKKAHNSFIEENKKNYNNRMQIIEFLVIHGINNSNIFPEIMSKFSKDEIDKLKHGISQMDLELNSDDSLKCIILLDKNPNT